MRDHHEYFLKVDLLYVMGGPNYALLKIKLTTKFIYLNAYLSSNYPKKYYIHNIRIFEFTQT